MLYTYRCRKCEEVFERRLRMDDRKVPETEPCPNCGEMEVYQSISAPRIVREHGSRIKTDDGWNEVKSKIKETYKINNIK
jgi:putative FmdB family regulatory protein